MVLWRSTSLAADRGAVAGVGTRHPGRLHDLHHRQSWSIAL